MRFLTIVASLLLVVLQAGLSIASVTGGNTGNDTLPACGVSLIDGFWAQDVKILTGILAAMHRAIDASVVMFADEHHLHLHERAVVSCHHRMRQPELHRSRSIECVPFLISKYGDSNCYVIATEKYSKDSCGVPGRDRSNLISGVGISFGVLAIVAFALRVTAKLTSPAGVFGADDYVMALALVSSLLT